MKQKSHIRLLKIISVYWPLLVLSIIAAIFFVVFNSASIWITATMINNVLIDFNDMVAENVRLMNLENSSANDKLKLFSNQLLLKDSAIETMSAVCISLVVVFGIKNIALYMKNITVSIVQFRLITDLRNKLYNHLHYLSLSYFNKNKSGELTAILVSDIDNMRGALSTSFQKLFVEPINIIAFLTLLFIISQKLTAIAILVVPISGAIIFGIAQSIRRRAARSQAKLAGITSIIAETLSSIRIVKAFVMKNYELRRFYAQTKKYYELMLRKDRLRLLSSPITETVGASLAALLLFIGARDVLVTQSISSEDFIRFILLLFSVLGPIKSLGNVFNELQNGLASADRVFSILDIKSDINDIENAVELNQFENHIAFKDVSFHYDQSSQAVLKNVDFSIKSGQILALVGPSGAGKSTLVDLIPRFYDVTDGAINIDGKNIKDVKLDSLRSLMGIVTQETFLFDDSVKANIAYGFDTISDDIIKFEHHGYKNEIERFLKSDLTWHRPTQKFGSADNFFNILWNNALSDKFKIFNEEISFHINSKKLCEKDRDAFRIMGLEFSADRKTIQKKFKTLVKKFHPDKHSGNKQYEDKLKKITLAYSHLKTIMMKV